MRWVEAKIVFCLQKLIYILSFISYAGIGIITILTYYFVPWRLITALPPWILLSGSMILACAIFTGIAFDRLDIGFRLQRAFGWISRQSTAVCLLALITVGIALRLLWIAYVPPVQFSDFAAYWNLAVQLVEAGQYVEIIDGYELHAHRPIGLPVLLATVIWAIGPLPEVPVIINLLAFAVTSLLIFDVVRQLGSNVAALLAVLMFVVYPANIAMTGLAATEPLSLCLYFAVGWAVLALSHGRVLYAWLTGVLLGWCVLVRPSLLPALALIILFLAVVPRSARWTTLILMAAGFLLIISPWVARNLVVFGDFLMVSTNGGDVFFRANNSLATGGYTLAGDRPLGDYLYNELLWSQTGYAWGAEWIRSNPTGFLKLAVVKLGMLLANGAVPIEWTLTGPQGEKGSSYFILYGFGQGWWVLLWTFCGVALYRHRRDLAQSRFAALLFSLVLVVPAVHSIFESQPRHHAPMVAFVVVLAALAYLPKGTRLRDPWAEASRTMAS